MSSPPQNNSSPSTPREDTVKSILDEIPSYEQTRDNLVKMKEAFTQLPEEDFEARDRHLRKMFETLKLMRWDEKVNSFTLRANEESKDFLEKKLGPEVKLLDYLVSQPNCSSKDKNKHFRYTLWLWIVEEYNWNYNVWKYKRDEEEGLRVRSENIKWLTDFLTKCNEPSS